MEVGNILLSNFSKYVLYKIVLKKRKVYTIWNKIFRPPSHLYKINVKSVYNLERNVTQIFTRAVILNLSMKSILLNYKGAFSNYM